MASLKKFERVSDDFQQVPDLHESATSSWPSQVSNKFSKFTSFNRVLDLREPPTNSGLSGASNEFLIFSSLQWVLNPTILQQVFDLNEFPTSS